MASRRRDLRADQLCLFHPAPNRPQWSACPSAAREVVVRLLAQLLRDHMKRQQVDRSDGGADDE